jgi:hypothetical protein
MELEFGYQKVETNQKSLKLVIAMDVHELIIAMEQNKHLKKENVELNIRMRPQVNNLKESTETIKHLQFNIQELSCHAPIIQEQLEDL